jgi:hypothetical protein
MFSYMAYGLGIHSALPLPELVAQEVAADVVIRLGKVDRSLLETVDAIHAFWATAEEACHFFKGVGAFLVRGGREIIADLDLDADARPVRLSILGPALALVLHQRGRFVLHASAVAVFGSAVAFLGGHGWGKSTTAAALYTRGHDMMTDDATAVHMDTDGPKIIPSFPQFKLWPEAVVALGEVPEALPLLHPDLPKRAQRLTQGFVQTPLPLTRLYVLDEGPALESTPLQSQEALQELMHHWYGARFGRQLLQATGIAAHFRQCTRLASQVSIYRLQRPVCLAALPELARFVEEDLAYAI